MKVLGPLLGRCAIGCLLVLGMGGCATGHRAASSSAPTSRTSTSGSSAPASATTTHDDVVATRRFSGWLLHAVPMPPGAREWSRSPTAHYRHASVGIGPSDPAFTRTTWWTLPMSGEAFGSWLHAHVPRGLRADSSSGGPVESSGVWDQEWDLQSPGTAAHTVGWVNFSFMPRGDRLGALVVRVDTFVGARFARTVLLPADTTSVTIRRTERSFEPHSRPHTAVRTITDPRAVADLVRLVNGLPGAMTAQFVASCPAIVTERSYTMAFTSPQGRYVASLPTIMCWPRLTLSHDGVKAGPPLDPGPLFVKTADRYLTRPHPARG